jgi:hypothetical protein
MGTQRGWVPALPHADVALMAAASARVSALQRPIQVQKQRPISGFNSRRVPHVGLNAAECGRR